MNSYSLSFIGRPRICVKQFIRISTAASYPVWAYFGN